MISVVSYCFSIKLVKHNLWVNFDRIGRFFFVYITLLIIIIFHFLLLRSLARMNFRSNLGSDFGNESTTLHFLLLLLQPFLFYSIFIVKTLHQNKLWSFLYRCDMKLLSWFRVIGGSHCLWKIFRCWFLVKLFTLLIDFRFKELIWVLKQVYLGIGSTSFSLLLVRRWEFLSTSIFRSEAHQIIIYLFPLSLL